jgi:hypothetical protein
MFIQSYLIEHQSDKRLQDRRIQENLWIAVESYIMNQVHDKVYSKICSKHQKENKLFIDRCRKLRMTLIPSLLGISKDYDCNYPLTIKELEKIGNGQSPVDKLYCLSDALDNIQTDVCTHYKSLLRIGEPTPLPSDDLICLLATIIVKANILMFLSDVYYVENFHWPFSDGDRLSFVIVTVKAAVEYIKGPEVSQYLPQQKQQQPSQPTRRGTSRDYVPQSLLDLHKDDPPPLEETMAKLSRLKMKADMIDPQSSASNRSDGSMGPFFDKLMEKDGVISSSDM